MILKAGIGLSYNSADGLYRFEIDSCKPHVGYVLAEYLKRGDPTITELEIPAEFNGKPVTIICDSSFSRAKYLRRVVIPPSVIYIASYAFVCSAALESVELSESPIKLGGFAFSDCKNLKRVEFGDGFNCPPPELGPRVFHGCEKLPPELLAMSMTRSFGELLRVCRTDYRALIDNEIKECDSFRADVFEILAKNKCYKKLNVKFLFEKMINDNRHDLLLIAEKYGMLDNAALLDLLINYTIENQKTEFTAYLLELKKRKFGFNGGNDFEL